MNIQGLTAKSLLDAVSASNSAAATSGWVDVRGYEGTVMVLLAVGTITGTITFTFHTSAASGGTNPVAITPLEGAIAEVDTDGDNTLFAVTFPSTQLLGWLRVTGTVVTGPAPVAYSLVALPKYGS